MYNIYLSKMPYGDVFPVVETCYINTKKQYLVPEKQNLHEQELMQSYLLEKEKSLKLEVENEILKTECEQLKNQTNSMLKNNEQEMAKLKESKIVSRKRIFKVKKLYAAEKEKVSNLESQLTELSEEHVLQKAVLRQTLLSETELEKMVTQLTKKLRKEESNKKQKEEFKRQKCSKRGFSKAEDQSEVAPEPSAKKQCIAVDNKLMDYVLSPEILQTSAVHSIDPQRYDDVIAAVEDFQKKFYKDKKQPHNKKMTKIQKNYIVQKLLKWKQTLNVQSDLLKMMYKELIVYCQILSFNNDPDLSEMINTIKNSEKMEESIWQMYLQKHGTVPEADLFETVV